MINSFNWLQAQIKLIWSELRNLKKDGEGEKSGIKGIATQTNAPTVYTPETYPNGLFESYKVNLPLTLPNSWGSAVTQAELDANFVYFDVTNGSVDKVLSKKINGDSAYQIAVKNGFVGTEAEYLISLKGLSKIPTWSAIGFPSGAQTIYNGQIYESNAVAIATDVPGISSKWVEKISGGDLLKYFDLISNLEETENLFNINSPLNQNNSAIYDTTWEITSIGGFTLSYWIPLLPSTEYTFLYYGLGGKNAQLTDSLKNKIGGIKVGTQGSSNNPFSFSTPSNCYGMYYTIKSIAESIIPPQLMVVKGNGKKANGELLDFIPYGTPTDSDEIIQIKAKGDNLIFADRLQVGAKMGLNTVATLADIPDASGIVNLPLFTKVICSGTSITNGVGSNNSNGIDEEKTWRKYLLDSLNNCLGRAISVVNGGVNGQNTTGMKTNLGALLSGNTNQIVIIEGAINDAQTAGAGLALSVTKSNLENMVDSVIASGNVPILTTPMPINYTSEYGGYYTVQKRNDLSFIVRLVAKNKNIRLVDLDLFTNSDSNLLADGLHPNAKGHAFIANAITSKLV